MQSLGLGPTFGVGVAIEASGERDSWRYVGAAAIGLANLAFAATLAAGGRRLLHQFKPPGGVTPV